MDIRFLQNGGKLLLMLLSIFFISSVKNVSYAGGGLQFPIPIPPNGWLAGQLDAGSGHHPGPNYIPGSGYNIPAGFKSVILVSGVWSIYGPGDGRTVGAAGNSGAPAGSGWPLPGSPEGCLMLWVGPKFYGCVTEANRQPDSAAFRNNPAPLYEVVLQGPGQIGWAVNDDNLNDNSGGLQEEVWGLPRS